MYNDNYYFHSYGKHIKNDILSILNTGGLSK